jgi:RNA polymerase sigma-70 factor (ECF subfamily)
MAIIATDQELITRVLRGEQQAFGVLVQRYQNMAFTIAYRYANNREDAEELAQSAFLKAYNNLGTFRGDAKFSTWFYTIVSSLCLSHLRKKKQQIASLDDEHVFARADNFDSGSRANQVEARSKAQMVRLALDMLSPPDAQVLNLFYQGEQSLEEIGRIMEIDANTAKVRLHRARQKLKQVLETRFASQLADRHEI